MLALFEFWINITENENKLRVRFWGNIKFIEDVLSSISVLKEAN